MESEAGLQGGRRVWVVRSRKQRAKTTKARSTPNNSLKGNKTKQTKQTKTGERRTASQGRGSGGLSVCQVSDVFNGIKKCMRLKKANDIVSTVMCR